MGKRKRLTIIMLSVILLISLIVMYLRLVVAPVIKTVSEEQMRSLTVTAVNEAVLATMSATPAYADMVVVTYDGENNISSVRIKSAVVNEIVQKTTLATQEKLASIGTRGVNVPIGSLSGMMYFSGKGPSVNLRVVPVGSITAQLCSEFKEAGINQTNHRISLKLNASVSVVLPGAHNVVNTVAEVLILDSVLIGKIPQTYLNSTSTQDMMDLIP